MKTTLTEKKIGEWTCTEAAHLLRRAMIAPRYEEITRAVTEGMERTVERLLTPFAPSLELISDWAGTEPMTSPPPPGKVYNAWYFRLLTELV